MTADKALCIYHGNCADGFTAAWAVHKAYGDAAEFFAGKYQEPPPDVTGRDVIMVDFSYKRPVLAEMIGKAKSFLLLDHHKSAQADLEALAECGANLHFDMSRSGALMAWQYFHP